MQISKKKHLRGETKTDNQLIAELLRRVEDLQKKIDKAETDIAKIKQK